MPSIDEYVARQRAEIQGIQTTYLTFASTTEPPAGSGTESAIDPGGALDPGDGSSPYPDAGPTPGTGPGGGDTLTYSLGVTRVRLAPTLRISSRPLGDPAPLIEAGAEQFGAARGRGGDRRGTTEFAEETTRPIDAVGRTTNTLRDALAGSRAGKVGSVVLSQTRPGVDGRSPFPERLSDLGNQNGRFRVGTWGLDPALANDGSTIDATFRAQTRAGANGAVPVAAIGLYSAGGALLGVGETGPGGGPLFAPVIDREYRFDVSYELTIEPFGTGVMTDTGRTVFGAALVGSANRPAVPVAGMQFGTGTTDPDRRDRTLADPAYQVPIETIRTDSRLGVWGRLFGNEPSPDESATFREIGLIDSDERLLYRVVTARIRKNPGVSLGVLLTFEFGEG